MSFVPRGASKGAREASELCDGGERFGGLDVQRAVTHINDEMACAVLGMAADDQAALDERLIWLDGTPHKERLGANATPSVPMAAAHAAAASDGLPLHRYLGGEDATLRPIP